MSDQQVPQKISKEMANQAYTTVVQAISAAMQGKFPAGIEHVEVHMEIKGAVQVLGAALKEYYEPTVVASDAVTEAPQPDASEKVSS